MSALFSEIGSVLLISVCSAVVSMIAPRGEIKKYIKLICSLAVVASLALPVISAVLTVRDVEYLPPDASGDVAGDVSAILEYAKQNIEKNTASKIEAEFGISGVGVFAVLDPSDLSSIDITELYITVPRGTNIRAVENYILQMRLCTGTVTVKEKDDG